MGEAAEDLWHVRFGTDEVKRLSLEQLDDLFRLDVISADTQVWQEGMEEWLPLSVVAGLGDDEPESVSIPVSQPPPATVKRVAATTQMGWPPPPAAAVSSFPPPAFVPSAPPPPRSTGVTTRPPPSPPRPTSVTTRPPPPSARSNAPLAPVMSSWPPDAAWSDPPRPPVAVSGFAPTLSAGSTPFSAPLAPSPAVFEDTAPRARRGGSGGWVIVLAAAVGLAVTLYRNDVVHAAASSMGQTATMSKLEAALGGPGFGTPRAVSKMTTRPAFSIDSVVAPAPTAPPTVTSTPTTTPEPVAEAPRTPTPEPQKATARTETTPVSARAPRAAAASPAPRSGGAGVTDPDNVFKQPKKGKKGNEYDPLNPSL
jgi:hypothetical protein